MRASTDVELSEMTEEKKADEAAPPPDEANDFETCLPVEVGALKVDATGFHAPCEVAWADVVGVEASGERLHVQMRSPDGFCRVAIDERVGCEAAGKVQAAWHASVVDGLKSGTPLRGGLLPGFRALAPLMWLLGGLMFAWAIASCAISIGVAENVAADAGRGSDAIVAGGVVVCALAGIMAIVLFAYALRYRRMTGLWKSWEYDLGGIKVSPSPDSRIVLSPLAADFISPRVAVLNGVRVPLAWMTSGALLTRALMYTGRRSQATVARDSYGETILVPLMCGLLWVVTLVVYVVVPRFVAAQAAVFIAASIATAAWMWSVVVSRRRFRKLFLEGRALVERLGW